jgi:GMP synthase-like glutamine amidotransferase
VANRIRGERTPRWSLSHPPGKPRPASDRVDCPAPGAFDAGSHRHRSQSHGGQADIRRLNCGEPLPDRLANHDGVVVFAGPMSANDTLDWVRRDIKWPETPLAEDKPLLGLRLGAQMLARALGARVFSYDEKRSEIGYYPIEPTLIGNRLCPAPFPRTVYQWHSDRFNLPHRAKLLPSLWLRPACSRPAVPP